MFHRQHALEQSVLRREFLLQAGVVILLLHGNRSRVIIMGISYIFNLIFEINWAMSLIYFMNLRMKAELSVLSY